MVVRRRMGRSNVVFKNNKIVKCGTSEKSGKACRPLIRINKDTPITIPELLKLVEMKKMDMDGIINWRLATFKSSL